MAAAIAGGGVTPVDVTVAPPVQAATAAPPVDVLRCWWCDEPIGMTADGKIAMCVNPKCEAYGKQGLDFDEQPMCEQRTYGGYGRNAVSPPEYCETLPLPGTDRCAAHTEDDGEYYDEPWDDDGPDFVIDGHEHNDYE